MSIELKEEMKVKKTFQVLAVMVSLALMAVGVGYGKAYNIGVAICKYDDTFLTGVRNAITGHAKGKAKILCSLPL
jgi:hypothetical protein